MGNWKVILEQSSKKIEINVKAASYSEAYLNATLEYPDSRILSIKPSERKNNSQKKKK